MSEYLESTHEVRVFGFALDLSTAMLEVQKFNNPGLVAALNQDVRRTSLRDKQIDLALMIDVLEHVPAPSQALMELRRISKYIIFKVLLELAFVPRLFNLLHLGEPRRRSIKAGHINAYSAKGFVREVERSTGHLAVLSYCNAFDYDLKRLKLVNIRDRLRNTVARRIFAASPALCGVTFGDHVVALIRCS